MSNTKPKKNIIQLLIVTILIFVLSANFIQRETLYAEAHIVYQVGESRQPEGANSISIGTFEFCDLPSNTNTTQNGTRLYEYMRAHQEDGNVITYDVSYQHAGQSMLTNYLGIQPLNTYTYSVLRAGNGANNSIVIVILAEGFRANEMGSAFIQPEFQRGTFVYNAIAVKNTMLNTHPFNDFRDFIRVYAIHTVSAESGISRDHPTSPGGGPNRNTYFDSRFEAASRIRMPVLRRSRARNLATAVNANAAMLQIIANTQYNSHGGVAWMGSYTHGLSLNVSLTSMQNTSNAHWNNAWHGTFIHEFGHSFGQLIDEHDNANTRRESSANATRNGNANTVKWQHFRGHGRVLNTPRSIGSGWFVPASGVGGLACIMRNSRSSNQFSAVSASELSRRMAAISGDAFFGKHLDGRNHPIPSIAHFTLNPNLDWSFNRIVPYAFHGNTTLQSVTILRDFGEIGNFAFIGATNLRVMNIHAYFPPRINDTTFAGLDRNLITINIPRGRYQVFRNVGWTGFRIIEMDIWQQPNFSQLTGNSVSSGAYTITATPNWTTAQNFNVAGSFSGGTTFVSRFENGSDQLRNVHSQIRLPTNTELNVHFVTLEARATNNGGGGLFQPSRESRLYFSLNGANVGATQHISRNNNWQTFAFAFPQGQNVGGGQSFGVTARSRFANIEITNIRITATHPNLAGVAITSVGSINLGETRTLTVNPTPARALITGTPIWSSSSTNIVEIVSVNGRNATIRGITQGSAVITVTVNGFTATRIILVSVPNLGDRVYCNWCGSFLGYRFGIMEWCGCRNMRIEFPQQQHNTCNHHHTLKTFSKL
ncbi:MAG: M64 family metallo-endopeptidase [Firmicutes bacterium]|nr:M64 family metallo-endopeptidase [Bacillota bacterium]